MKNSHPHDIIDLIAQIREAANVLIENELQARGLTGIVPAHGLVFSFLFKQDGPVPIKSLVERSGRVKSTVTGIVHTLERHGYVFKQQCSLDGRSVLIGLTEKGKAIRQDFEEISMILKHKVYGNMPQAHRRQLMELLSTIALNLEA